MPYLDPTLCPPDETIACLLDGRIDEENRQALLVHAADCDSCRFVLAEALAMSPAEPAARKAAVRPLVLAASLAVATGVAWLAVLERGPSAAEVLRAGGAQRAVPTRLSAAPYQPPRPAYRSLGERGLASPEAWDLAAVARDALAALERRRSVDALQAMGAAHLSLGNHDEAIALFAEAAATNDASEHQVDLAAALLARGIHHEEPADAVRAFEALARALERDPADPAALFDRALALEQLALPRQAIRAWEDYLAVDAASGWAAEARAHLQRLRGARAAAEAAAEAGTDGVEPPEGGREQLASWAAAHPGLAARWLRSRLLVEWATAWQAGRYAAAEESLRRGTLVAAAVAERTGDRSLLETLDAALRDRGQRDALAPVHAEYGNAWRALDETAPDRAAAHFAAVAGSLARLGAGEAEWHRVGSLAAAVYSGEDGAALRTELAAALAAAPRPLVRAHLLWLSGLQSLRQGANDAAITHLAAAAPLLREAGERNNAAWVRYLESEALQIAGDWAGGWRSRVEALHLLGPHSPRLGTCLLGAAVTASLEGAAATALAFEEEALPALERMRPGVEVAEAWLWRAHILHQTRQPIAAKEALHAAGAMVTAVGHVDPALGRSFQARYALTRALVGAGQRPQQDLALVDEALPTIERDLPYYSPLLRQRRAELLLATGQPQRARAEMATVLTRAAELRLSPARELWSDGRDVGRDSLVAAVTLDVETFGDPLAGLRTLLAYRLRATQGPPLDPVDGLRGSLREGEVALVYAQLERDLLVWRVDAGGATWAKVPLPAEGLDATVARWAAALDQPSGGELGRRLSRLLLPFWNDGELPAKLRIVPDEGMAGVPWAALPPPGAPGRAAGGLVDATELTVAPFALVGDDPLAPPQAMLVVADARASRGLSPLAGARDEAAGLRGLFPGLTVLVGDEARRDRVLVELPKADIAHFASHAWSHPRLPALARLSFAPGADGRAWLQAHEIPRLGLERTGLVVLAGCSTARSPGSDGVATHGLAQGFLAAGVPRVLGSLWPVEDEPTARLFRAFYGELARGRSPEAALRGAQRELSAAGEAPRNWAGFILLRG